MPRSVIREGPRHELGARDGVRLVARPTVVDLDGDRIQEEAEGWALRPRRRRRHRQNCHCITELVRLRQRDVEAPEQTDNAWLQRRVRERRHDAAERCSSEEGLQATAPAQVTLADDLDDVRDVHVVSAKGDRPTIRHRGRIPSWSERRVVCKRCQREASAAQVDEDLRGQRVVRGCSAATPS